MNWLGKIIQQHVHIDDTVLDIGCGIMQATTDSLGKLQSPGNLICKSIVGVDIHTPYLDKIKDRYQTIKTDVTNTQIFPDKSYDIVLCLDVLEHLPKEQALHLLDEMDRIARKVVIAYTPKEFHSNEEHVHESWDMGSNEHQAHQCLVTQDEFRAKGYDAQTTDIDHNTLAIKYLRKSQRNLMGLIRFYLHKLHQRISTILGHMINGAKG